MTIKNKDLERAESDSKYAKWLATAALVIALLGNVTVYFANNKTTDKILSARAASRLYNCQQLNVLKANVRQDAIDNYNHLDRNGKLLGIKITPELRNQARIDKENTLEKYKAVDCSIIVQKGYIDPPVTTTTVDPPTTP